MIYYRIERSIAQLGILSLLPLLMIYYRIERIADASSDAWEAFMMIYYRIESIL